MMAVARLLLPLLAAAGSVVGEIQPIEVKGSKFFYKNGTQFFMKGIAYQQDIAAAGGVNDKDKAYSDPLANQKACERDVPYLEELGTNTIRTYAIDPSADHSACMKLLQDAGIYVVADLGEPRLSINRENPEWNAALFSRYQQVIDELAQYPNVIGFFAGNEVSNNKSNTDASAYVKAAVRDTKKYIKDHKSISRWLGVGYAANDDEAIREPMAAYFNCGASEESIDFFGYNIYSWCGEDSSIKKSGYDRHAKSYEDYSVPVFFAEYGCNKVPGGAAGRTFTETGALYSDSISGVFSGGIVYMYFQEENDYGLVKVNNGKVTKMKDFDALKKQTTQADPKRLEISDYTPSGKPRECPVIDDTWKASNALPPTPDKSLCDCMVKSRACAPKSDASPKKFGEIFGYICGVDKALCAGIGGDTSTGVYGAYSMCDDEAKLAFVLDAYYAKQKDPGACDFDGVATTQQAATEATCSAALASASVINAHAATATSSAGGKSASTDNSFAVRGVSFPRILSVGSFAFGMYMVAALGAGAAAILL